MHDYVVDFFTGGVYMLLRSWSRDGLAAPPAQMAELTYTLVSGYNRAARPRSASGRPATT